MSKILIEGKVTITTQFNLTPTQDINTLQTQFPDDTFPENSWYLDFLFQDDTGNFDVGDIQEGDSLILYTGSLESNTITSFKILKMQFRNVTYKVFRGVVVYDYENNDNDNPDLLNLATLIGATGALSRPSSNLKFLSTVSHTGQFLSDTFVEPITNFNLSKLDKSLGDVLSSIGLDSNGDYVPKGSSASTTISSDIEEIFSSLSGGLGASVSVSDSAPTDPSPGDLWWNSDEGVLKIYYSDSDSSQWVDASPSGSSSSSGGSNGTLSLITDGTSTVSFDSANEVVMNTDLNVNAINLSGHIIPTQNAQFDLGNAEYKIRHLFLSDNSLRFGKDGTGDISGEYISFGKDNLDRNAEVYTDQDAGVVPPTPYSAGKKGDIRVFPDFMYVCIRTSEVDDGLTVNWVRSSVESVW